MKKNLFSKVDVANTTMKKISTQRLMSAVLIVIALDIEVKGSERENEKKS